MYVSISKVWLCVFTGVSTSFSRCYTRAKLNLVGWGCPRVDWKVYNNHIIQRKQEDGVAPTLSI